MSTPDIQTPKLAPQDQELIKGLGPISATTLVIGSMIGSGIFIVSAEIARLVDSPALLIGGTNDPAWNGALARELSDDVLELEGADHGLARIEHLAPIVAAIGAFLH